MAQYGFRIFKAERMNGTGNTPVKFVDTTWGDFTAHLHRSFELQKGRKRHENPRDAFNEDGKPVPLDPNSRIVRLDWVKRSGTSVFFSFSSGKNDGFVDAMSAADDAPDVSIVHLAPRRQYRGVYTLPPNQTEGVLALEVISRSCPVAVLRQWSNRWSEELVEADKKDGKASKHCRVKFEQLTDSGAVTTFLNGGEPQEIVLIEHESPGNGLPDVVQYRLTAPVRQKTTVMQTVKNWVISGDGRFTAPTSVLTGVALLMGGLLSTAGTLSTLRLKLTDRDESHQAAEDAKRNLDEAVPHVLTAALACLASAIVIIIAMNYPLAHGDPTINKGFSSVIGAALTFVAVLFVATIIRLYAAYVQVNNVPKQVNGFVRHGSL